MLKRRIVVFTLLFLMFVSSAAWAAPKAQQVDFLLSQVRNSTGSLASGTVTFYAAGTTTLKTIWTDRDQATPAANPYTLDANGTAQIYASGLYKVLIKNAAGTTIYTRDNLYFEFSPSDDIDALQYSPYTFTQATIEAALTAIGTTNKVTLLLRPGTWVISSNADWSSYTNVTFKIVPGVKLSGAFTLNIPNLDNGLYQIFDSTLGAVTLSGQVKEVFPEWWYSGTGTWTTAIQSAINATPVGSIVKITRVMATNAELTGKSGIGIVGTGSNTSGIYLAGAAVGPNLIAFEDKNNWFIHNIRLDSSGLTSVSAAPMIGVGRTVAGLDSYNFTLRDVYLYAGFKQYEGILNDGNASATTIVTNGVIDNSTFDSFYRNGMAIQGGIGWKITNSRFINTAGTSPQQGIDIEPGTGALIRDIVISGNQFYGNATGDLAVNATGGSTINSVAITGNTFKSVEGGISVGKATDVTISGNVLFGHATPVSARYGITIGVDGNDNTTITGNTIRNYYESIRVEGNLLGLTIIGNTLDDATIAGIRVVAGTASVKNCVIVGNKIDNTVTGIHLYTAANSIEKCNVSLNTISNVTTGISWGPTNAVINNTIAHNIMGAGVTTAYSGTAESNHLNDIIKTSISAYATWDPASIANGARESTDVTVTGALLGDFVKGSFSLDLAGLTLSATVKATNTVTATLSNNTGGAVDLASGTLSVVVTPK